MIKRNLSNFTGFIVQGEKKLPFHAENRIFNLITERVGIFAEFIEDTIVSPDHFLHGYTTDGYQIALYTGYDERKISANYKLRPGIYIVSRGNLCEYDMSKMQAVEFVGGTLNNLYEQREIMTGYDKEKKCYIKTYPESRTEYKLKIRDLECKLIIRNYPSELDPSKMDLVIRYEFAEEVPLKTVKLIYNVLTDICRLMTNRKNVGVDAVRVFKNDDESKKWDYFADGLIDYQDIKLTKKANTNCILFEHLHD